MFAQFRVPPFTIWIKQQQFVLVVSFLSLSSAYSITNFQPIFNTKIFKPPLFCSHAICLHTSLTKFFLSCTFYRRISSVMNAVDGQWLYFREFSINVNKLFTVLLLVYFAYVCPCTIVIACLLLYPLFYTDVVAIFLFIRCIMLSCKIGPLVLFLDLFCNNTISIFGITYLFILRIVRYAWTGVWTVVLQLYSNYINVLLF